MKVNFSTLNKKLLTIVKIIGREADDRDIPVYLVGGFVRDVIMKKNNLDMDIVLEGEAIPFAKHVVQKKNGKLTIYDQFGTATIEYADGIRVDFVTARSERYARPGDLPAVSSGTLQDDLSRRDFSINALAMNINQKKFGNIVDSFNGLADIKNKKIRVLHEKSFMDDPTRILRAVQYEQRLNFRMDRWTLTLLKKALNDGYVRYVKPARYFFRFRILLQEPLPLKCIKRLHPLGGLSFLRENFKPDFCLLATLERNIERLTKDRFYSRKNWELSYLLGILSVLSISELEFFMKDRNLSVKEKRILLSLEEIPSIIGYLKNRNLKPSEIFQKLISLEEEILYYIRVCCSSATVARHVDNFLKKYRFIKSAITGDDVKTSRVISGRQVGVVLKDLLYKKLDGIIHTREDEMKELKRISGC